MHVEEEVLQKLRLKYGFDEQLLSNIVILESGHVLAKNESGYSALGCKFCITHDVEQDKMGYPSMGNIRLLYFGDVYRIEDLDEAVKANTWLCPKCRLPISSIYPKFGTRRKENVSIQNSEL